MLHDETEYPEPFAFLPERWILKDGQKEPRDPEKVAFGFGRRCVLTSFIQASQPHPPRDSICPGKDLADDSVSRPSNICHHDSSVCSP